MSIGFLLGSPSIRDEVKRVYTAVRQSASNLPPAKLFTPRVLDGWSSWAYIQRAKRTKGAARERRSTEQGRSNGGRGKATARRSKEAREERRKEVRELERKGEGTREQQTERVREERSTGATG